MKTTNANIFLVVQGAISGKTKISWNEIVQEVQDAGLVIKNWLKVRGVLQYFINHGRLVRTSDLRVEEYIVS